MTDLIVRLTRRSCAWCALLLMLPALSAYSVTIPGDPADGTIRIGTNTVTGSEQISIGHRGTTGAELATGIYLFELPDFAGSADINNAALSFSYVDRSGSFATNPANADIWGLGYTSTTALDTNWHLLGDSDTRTGNDLGTGIGTNLVVRLSDNFLTEDSNDPNDDPYRMALPGERLAGFLGLLYDNGAVSGDYAVIRVNVDAPTSMGNRGFDLASANATNESTRPVLSINENTTLVFDPFEDGDRTNGADPLDINWYKISGGSLDNLALSITNSPPGLGSGNALKVDMRATSRRLAGVFPSTALAEPGDFLRLVVPIQVIPDTFSSVDKVRFGLYGSGGAPIGADTTSTSGPQYNGYMIRFPVNDPGQNTNTRLSVVNDRGANGWLGGSGDDFLEDVNDADASFRENDPPRILEFTITRGSSTQMITRVEINGVQLNALDPGTDGDVADWDFVDTYDTIVLGANGDGIDFVVDEILVETSVALVQVVPHVMVSADVIALEVDTQPNVRYSLQEATDLVGTNWTDSGYRLTGDGSPLRVYDPETVEPVKAYRMENQ